jgi:hypothetical protein
MVSKLQCLVDLTKAITLWFLVCYGAFSSSSASAANHQIVYFDCQPDNLVQIRIFILPDIEIKQDKRVFDLDNLHAEKNQAVCKLSDSITIMIKMNVSKEDSKNNNVSVYLNGNLLSNNSFDEPDRSYRYLFMRLYNGDIGMTVTESNSEEKAATKKFDSVGNEK